MRTLEIQGWMSPDECQGLHDLAQRTKALGGYILEAGAWKGLSTSWLTEVGTVISVDSFQGNPNEPWDTQREFLANAARFGFADRLVCLHMKTEEAWRVLKGTRLHFALIDSDHSEPAVYADAVGVWDLVIPGGIVAFDDHEIDAVRKAITRFVTERGLPEPTEVTKKLVYLVKP